MMNQPQPFPFPNMPMMQQPFNKFAIPQNMVAPALYVGNLDERLGDEDLYHFFANYGPLQNVRVMRNKHTRKSRGFAFINFVRPRDAESALRDSQSAKLGGKSIRVMFKMNIKTLSSDSNLFVKNIDKNVTEGALENFFKEVGNVLSVKIATNSEGQSLGYGYVQFEKKEDAAKAIELKNNKKLGENQIQVGAFVPKNQRSEPTPKKNIYIKNFPVNLEKQDVESFIKKEFSKFGKIETSYCEKNAKTNRFWAFVTFESQEGAAAAVENYKDQPTTGNSEPLYVSLQQSKEERLAELKKEYLQKQNVTNLYLMNLKPTTTDEILKQAFEIFGPITSAKCGETRTIKDGKVEVKAGFINYLNSADAKRAIEETRTNETIKGLFIDQNAFINYLQTKEKRLPYLESQAKQRLEKQRNAARLGFGMPVNGQFPPYPMAPMGFMPPYRVSHFPPMQQQKPKRAPQLFNANQPNPNIRGPRNEQNIRGQHSRQVGGHQQHQQHQQYPQHINQNKPQQVQPPQQLLQQQQQQQQQNWTIQSVKKHEKEFLALDDNRKRQILGELLFPRVLSITDEDLAPKITGMLIDLDVLAVEEILEFLDNPEILRERVEEASELIQSDSQ